MIFDQGFRTPDLIWILSLVGSSQNDQHIYLLCSMHPTYTLDTIHNTLYIIHYTSCTILLCALQALFNLHDAFYIIHYTFNTLHTTHHTPHTTHDARHTTHYTPYTFHDTLWNITPCAAMRAAMRCTLYRTRAVRRGHRQPSGGPRAPVQGSGPRVRRARACACELTWTARGREAGVVDGGAGWTQFHDPGRQGAEGLLQHDHEGGPGAGPRAKSCMESSPA